MALSFAVPCFSMGFRLLSVWRDPMAVEHGRWVRLGIGIFILEFILLHAGIMLGAATMASSSGDFSVGSIAIMLAFYSVFAAAIALAFRSRMLFTSFLWVVIGRFVGVLVGITQDDKPLFMAHSLAAMAIYFVMVFASVLLPWPRLGITEAVAAETRVPNASGLWIEQPHRAIGPATVYFLLLGIAEITLLTWIDPSLIALR